MESLILYIQCHVIDKKQVLSLSDIKHHYNTLVEELSSGEFKESQNIAIIKEKLQNHFDSQIKIHANNTLAKYNNIFVYSSSLSASDVLMAKNSVENKQNTIIKNCAFELRKAILFTKFTPMIDNITVEDVCSKGRLIYQIL